MGSPAPAQGGNDRELLSRRQRFWNITLAVAAGQAGCLTLIIVIAAIFFGLWADKRFDMSPMITIISLVLSVPISLVAMFAVVRNTVKRIKVGDTGESKPTRHFEENGFGRDQDK